MRGLISDNLKDFIEQVNVAAREVKQSGIQLAPELVRSNLNKLAVYIGDGPELDYVQDSELIVSNEGSRRIKVRVYSPSLEQTLPVALHFHGGGHMCGSIDLYDTRG